jgi:hypothetical protein
MNRIRCLGLRSVRIVSFDSQETLSGTVAIQTTTVLLSPDKIRVLASKDGTAWSLPFDLVLFC